MLTQQTNSIPPKLQTTIELNNKLVEHGTYIITC